tara:strand:- start:127 stop:615 length:489 start_codon:yes stop_codon:yes gene_type:complete
MIWQYGNYKFDCNLRPPTLHKFSEWKTEFFRLENVDKYNVWLASGFVEDWKTLDIDIVLTNKPIYPELQKLMLEAIKLGVEKNIFIDICWWDKKPLDYTKSKKVEEVTKIVIGNKIIQDGRLITDWTSSEEIYPNLYKFSKVYPTQKQMKRIYKNKPILLEV